VQGRAAHLAAHPSHPKVKIKIKIKIKRTELSGGSRWVAATFL
jgi:hypothetical protein